MAQFKYISDQDYEWIASLATSVARQRGGGGFQTVQVTGDQFNRMAAELRRIKEELIDQSDVSEIAAAVAAKKG